MTKRKMTGGPSRLAKMGKPILMRMMRKMRTFSTGLSSRKICMNRLVMVNLKVKQNNKKFFEKICRGFLQVC